MAEQETFTGDLSAAVEVWSRDRWLPALTLLLAAASILPSMLTVVNPGFGILGLLFLPVALFSVGFYGTQRLWYMRLFRGQPGLRRDAIWEYSWKYLGRYFVLGLLAALPTIPFFFVGLIIGFSGLASHYHTGMSQDEIARLVNYGPLILLASVPYLLVDFALTFVTPALAFTTQSAGHALRIGLRMIPASWPACALYVIFPPLALQLTSALPSGLSGVSPSSPLWLGLLGLAAVMVNLVAKGATARFYLRRVPVPDMGALYGDNPDTLPPAPSP